MVHVYGAPEDTQLEADACTCDAPHEGAEVTYHVGAVELPVGWSCFTCGFDATEPRVSVCT